ncbi:MAG: four helix bundle protein [Patescibacteria group bacterium]
MLGSAPVVHKVTEFYKLIYLLRSKIPKKDRFGIYLKIENNCLELIDLLITASLESKTNKLPTLNTARTKTEVLKRLIRLSSELKIIDNKKYIGLEAELQEISKMINGWIKYVK